ncbi:3-oxoacyl-[acyl-carrier protein] reductase [Tistlia consotensis]|uniref:3-oxoacyl-[acyl-carrier protein] reductase n=1 Tax=Tistlia consotensis USBA 355 TaxID=560819 RepID=A0A1Y6BY49_9PROT|nr:SDR family NAD(P)-dependent oxidoreductase [Tistlia consotensis]SMF35546.1 3-oxoacyl-[acyl-carrier protein] reductase [Tistlia consotensis USBA 355]SNR70911.1 3-oxoacyl-[acyl-carrier protein] reductase [Tistlia consotensis]
MGELDAARPLALVTGAAGGIGLASAARLAEDGFQVVMTDLDRERLAAAAQPLRQRGTGVATRAADLRDEAALDALVGSLPRLDVLVNNAGIFDVRAFEALTSDDFRRMTEVNLIPVFALSQRAAARMPEDGRIVNIASRSWLGARRFAHYAASKAGVVGLTRAMALDLAPRRILVNAVAPGVIDTPILAAWSDAQRAALAQQQVIGRIGRPEDIASAVSFLASPRTGFITGQVIVVDGGASVGGIGGS